MLNKNYKLGSRWKLALLLPLTIIAFFVVSCTDKETPIKDIDPAEEITAEAPEMEVYDLVEEMPMFNGKEAAIEFRKYIAINLKYPLEAAEQGVGGKVTITFIVDKDGKVIVPDQETLAKIEGKPLDEVVVVRYRKGQEDAEDPEEKYTQMLKDEAVRVVSGSPAWTPGKKDGKAVAVRYSFPINFLLQ